MVPLSSLWLPIVASAVLVFIASSIIHMVLPYHRTDYRPVPSEDQVMEDLRRAQLEPGEYMVPHAPSPKESSSPEFVARLERGPVALITVLPGGRPSMGKALALWFVWTLLVSLAAAYVAGRALGPGAEYLEVFRFTGTTAMVAYVLGPLPQSIWGGRPWSTTAKTCFDGVVYSLLTAGVFGWLW